MGKELYSQTGSRLGTTSNKELRLVGLRSVQREKYRLGTSNGELSRLMGKVPTGSRLGTSNGELRLVGLGSVQQNTYRLGT